jgi:hypothetical protein
MATHRFKVGDTVHLRSIASRALGSIVTFNVTALLPVEGRAPEYRISSDRENHERVVAENFLEIVQ